MIQQPSNIFAVILAGGLGTRLREVVSDKPKVLGKVAGRPFLSYLLDQLGDLKISEVVLCIGYLGEQIQQEYGDAFLSRSGLPVNIKYSKEQSLLGTGGAVRQALSFVETQTMIVVNGDSFFDVNLEQMAEQHQKTRARATIALTEVSDVSRYGAVSLDENNAVIGFDEKSKQNKAGWINAGIYLMERGLFEDVGKNQSISMERELFPRWVGKGLFGFRSQGRFLDIGTPKTFEQAQTFFEQW